MAEQIDFGTLSADGGYFLLRNNPASPFVGPGQNGPYSHCFTYRNSQQSIKASVLDLLRSAKRKVFVTSFRIGDDDLLNALHDAAERLLGGVYVITALDEASLQRGLATIEDDSDFDLQAQNKRFESMTSHGIYVRGHSSCHAKFVVVDDRVALVSSANLETRAFEVTGENGVVVHDPNEVARLSRFFTRLWYEGCEREMPPGESYTVQKRSAEKAPCMVDMPTVDSPCGVIWTHHGEQIILRVIHDIIGRAQKRLVLSSFSLCGMKEHPELLLAPLQHAMTDRQLGVSILIRSRNNISGHRRDAQELARMGVRVFADSLNHAKGVIADGRFGALFSANFDAFHGLTTGVEVGVRLDGQRALVEAERYFAHAIGHSNTEFVMNPSMCELDQRLAAAWRHPWKEGRRLAVRADKKVWDSLKAASRKGPVLFLSRKERPLQIYVGGGRWSISRREGSTPRVLELLEKPNAVDGNATYDLLEEWLTSRTSDDAVRGFCPATVELDDSV